MQTTAGTPTAGAVLIVEDDRSIAVVLHDFLTWEGYAVVCAATGEEGWAHFLEHHPRAVITDCRMGDSGPGSMSGLDLAVRIKGVALATPIIMLSAMPPCQAHGVCDVVLRKPVPLDEVVSALRGLGVKPSASNG